MYMFEIKRTHFFWGGRGGGAKTSRGLQIKQHFRKNMVPDFG